MRNSAACLLLTSLLLSACDGDSSPSGADPADLAGNKPLVIAHRGASGHAPEHTVAAYDLALEQGADYIEQDVQMSADGVLVVLHDDTLDRTARGDAADCSGRAASKTLAQLKTCDMGSWFNEAHPDLADPAYVGLRMPTLDEVFARYGRDANYYIEIKSTNLGDDVVERELLRLIEAHGLTQAARTDRRVLIQSFQQAALQKVQALDAQLPLIQLYGSALGRARLSQAANYAVGVGPAQGDADAAFLDAAHALGLQVHPYTVNDADDLAALTALCVDGYFTNYPDRAVAARAAAPDCP